PELDLAQSLEKGVFTQDFHQGLVEKTYDLVVHSWKDLPTEERVGTEVVATLPRADVRDVLLVKRSALAAIQQKKSIRVFSSSPRRVYNLTDFLKWALPMPLQNVEFVGVRGN